MKVGIVGLGYVGLPLAVAFAEAGYEVVGLDTDRRARRATAPERVGRRGRALGAARGDRRALHCHRRLSQPRRLRRRRDLRPDAARQPPRARPHLPGRSGDAPLARPPRGTARRARVDDLSRHHPRAAAADPRGVRARGRAGSSASPTRPSASTRAAPTTRSARRRRLSGGLTDDVSAIGRRELYGSICDEVVEVSTPEAAELTKLLENIFRSVNIALVNELAHAVRPDGHRRLGGDRRRRARSPSASCASSRAPGWAATACPSTPSTWPSRRASTTSTPSSSSSPGKVNQAPARTSASSKIERTLNDVGEAGARLAGAAARRRLQGRRRRLREAPALKIVRSLRELGADIAYHDPHVPELPGARAALRPTSTSELAARGHRLRRHRPPRGRLRARRPRGAAGARLSRRDPRHRSLPTSSRL